MNKQEILKQLKEKLSILEADKKAFMKRRAAGEQLDNDMFDAFKRNGEIEAINYAINLIEESN